MVDISGSMKGSPLENTKNALIASLSHLNPQDTFNIIAFNEEFRLFSISMEPATVEARLSATNWVEATCFANGGTNMLNPLTQAMKLFQNPTASYSIPLIFLITDGTVENERQICNFVESYVSNGQPVCTPRLCTFGVDSIVFRMQRLFRTASSVIVSDITLGSLGLDSVELFPSYIPDLSLESPLMISGTCNGTFPESVKVTGILADMTKFEVDLPVQRKKDIQLTNVLAKRHMELITSQAWLLESTELEEKVSKMSIQLKIPSEYTCMVLVENGVGKKAPEPVLIKG
ncbi:hypothetical protein PIB30_022702 [Stylosanthes scabra]|uniref:VWFA domain-containing protein n=1 Tax=Stylosanthes scabra TaxID=79078 RepID=A0ABU6X8B4_9FABA|nr:hypothetical protein [Stylosanthes scabra]